LRDDGLVAYLNGHEIFRMNMPVGTVTSSTTSSSIVGGTNETFLFPTNLPPTWLVPGTNVLAVELHQSGPGTSDAVFDLELLGVAPPAQGPFALALQPEGSDLVITWSATGVWLEKADAPFGPWTPVALAATSPYRIAASSACKFYRLRKLD
jgi:hypothetical protein